MKRCVITGAAAGIGRELALTFGRAGYEVVGFDVDAETGMHTADELRAAGVTATMHAVDLSREEGVTTALRQLERLGPVEVFVHNAGVNHVGAFRTSDLEAQRRVVDVNLLAPMLLTSGLLAQDGLAQRGSLVFLSSLSRFVGYPGAAGYAASKDGLASYASSLAAALSPLGGHVLTVYPGPTRTEHARLHSPPGAKEEKRTPPAELASAIEQAVRKRKRVLVPGAGNRFFAALGHVLPRVTERAMKKVILDRLPSR